MGDILNDILRAADKHPNSRVSKLIRTVEEEPSQKNIVLLLIELSEHAEYATDFNISLRYYLEYFERLGINRDLMLNEAGLLLVNSSKIYSKRVDYVQSMVERQIMTLSNADLEIQQQKEQNQQESSEESTTTAEKPKRGRKRPLDAPTDPYEVQLQPKKFKKMTQEKRFAIPKTPTKAKSLLRNIEVEQQIHPACWQHATIYDLENEEEVDTKRNYKLFTYHIEHRYNTLVPDINFRLHFKVKDYMDAQEEEMDSSDDINNVWPPLSEEYVQKYIHLENHVLQQEIDPSKSWNCPLKSSTNARLESGNENEHISNQTLNTSINNVDTSLQNLNTTIANDDSNINDSGMGTSVLESSLDASQLDTSGRDSTLNNPTTSQAEADKALNQTQGNDSALGESILDQTDNLNESNAELNSSAETSENVDNTLNISTVGIEIPSLTNTESEVQTTTNSESHKKTEDDGKPDSGNVDVSATSNENAVTSLETENSSNTTDVCSTAVGSGKDASVDICESPENITEKETCCPTGANSSMDTEAEHGESSETVTQKESPSVNITNSEENVSEQNKESPPVDNILGSSSEDGVQHPPSVEDGGKQEAVTTEKSLQISGEKGDVATEESSPIAEESAKGKDAFIQLEIHVLKDNENEPSERLQLRIPNTDDEGVHLSDVFEDDLRLLSPTIKLPNIMPGVTNKDVTIHLDKELREALELRDGMMEHFSQETYKVPVIEEPKEHPLLFNILQLPPKLLRRKVLFKLGPEMDLFLKARSMKSARPVPPPREYRMMKQLQFFPLNNTDLSGVIDTPPNSPGHGSEFCGFTDDECFLDEDTCTEFCGFTEDEQNMLKVNTHRLSRDSGVGVDVATLTPEKEPLKIIFEETDIPNCKKDLTAQFTNSENSAFNKETTAELLNDLPMSIRNVLEAEIEDETKTDGVETTGVMSTEIEANPVATEGNRLNDIDKSSEDLLATAPAMDCLTETTNTDINQEKENLSTGLKEDTLTLSGETIGDETDKSAGTVADIDTFQDIESSSVDPNADDMIQTEENKSEEKNNAVDIMTSSEEKQSPNQDKTLTEEILEEHRTKDAAEFADGATKAVDIGLENENDSDNSQQDTTLFDLNLHGAKTKIQQWHEHLRPILAKSRERHHFDVFQLGTEIIDTIQTADNEEQNTQSETTFANIMDTKDESYVSRYFLSTLLLANQSNVNILVANKSSENPSAWSDIKLKLLSTKRHTVAIEDNIGMISNKKRKQVAPIEDKVKKKKTNSSNVLQGLEDGESSEDSEPLVNLQTSQSKLKRTPTKRSMNCDASNVAEKKYREASNSTACRQQGTTTKEYLIISQQHLPPLANLSEASLLMDMPTTSKQANRNLRNCEVNLNNIRILQPIEKVPRQGDDYDSGIFSIGDISSTSY